MRPLQTSSFPPLLLLALLAAPTGPAAAQALTNAGATLTVSAGTTLFVGGGVRHEAGGTLLLNGTLQTTGDFTAAAPVTGGGQLRFTGLTDQTLTGPPDALLPNLEVANTGPAGANRLLVPASLRIKGSLLLTSGLVRTAPTAVISLPDGATLAGEAPGRYVQGNLRISRAAVPGPLDFGHGVSLDGSGQSLGAVSITRVAGLLTAGLSYGTNLAGTTAGIDRIWTVEAAQAPTAPVLLTLSWLPDDDHGLNGFGQMQLWRQPVGGTGWTPAGAPGNANPGRTLTRAVAAFGRFTLSNAANPLPVELAAFTAAREGLGARLRWTTATERNTAYFAIEASPDGQQFAELSRVPAQGSSSQPQTYTFLDPELARYGVPLVYYRLRPTDLDGTTAYSAVRTVATQPAALLASLALEVYPNPLSASNQLTLRIAAAEAGPADLVVVDAAGRTLLHQSLPLLAGTSLHLLPEAAGWPAGHYLLRLRQGSRQQTVPVVRE